MPIIDLNMEYAIKTNEKELNMTWICRDFQPMHMDFIMRFESYQKVSINDIKDRIKVNIFGLKYFRSVDNNE